DLWEHLMQQVYGGEEQQQDAIPRQVLVPELPANHGELAEWLAGLRGGKVSIKVPQRGEKAALMETVAHNAHQSMLLHKSRRAGDLTTRSVALQELQEALELPMPLLRIECYDISHVQGTNVVASMVVVEDGLAKKSEYRKFAITGDAAIDDTASMHDVITRRFRHYLADQEARNKSAGAGGDISAVVLDEYGNGAQAGDAATSKFAYPPNLVVVDGGIPQVNAAQAALAELGITDVAVVGLAKRLEEVWVPDSDFPVILPRASQGLYLLQRIRDEAHRFAITFHRAKRGKAMTASVLDTVPGLGAAKQKALLAHFGSLKKVRAATVAELQEAKGVGPVLAKAVHDTLAGTTGAAAPAVNMATGEILD
ncbi:excinuclease ABC subunit UvrC, partial [Arthrobacter sp. A2-55]